MTGIISEKLDDQETREAKKDYGNELESWSAQLEILTLQLVRAISEVTEAQQVPIIQGVINKIMAVVPEQEAKKVAYQFNRQYQEIIKQANLEDLRKRVERYQTFSVRDVAALKNIQDELKYGTLEEKEILWSHLRHLVVTIKERNVPDYAAISISEFTVPVTKKSKKSSESGGRVSTSYTYYHAGWRVKGKKNPDGVNLCNKD